MLRLTDSNIANVVNKLEMLSLKDKRFTFIFMTTEWSKKQNKNLLSILKISTNDNTINNIVLHFNIHLDLLSHHIFFETLFLFFYLLSGSKFYCSMVFKSILIILIFIIRCFLCTFFSFSSCGRYGRISERHQFKNITQFSFATLRDYLPKLLNDDKNTGYIAFA